jgi:hypothetical protein
MENPEIKVNEENQNELNGKLTINHIDKSDVDEQAEEINFLSMRLGEIRNLENCNNLKVF